MNGGTFLVSVLLLAASAGPGRAEETIPLTDLGRLEWMAGSWRMEDRGAVSEEHWMAPAGGIMVGMNRSVGPDGQAFFEYLRIARGKDGLLHYLASPRGKRESAFRLVEVGDRRAVFANDRHDWPTRITYRLAEDGTLRARVEGRPGDRVEEFRWERAPR